MEFELWKRQNIESHNNIMIKQNKNRSQKLSTLKFTSHIASYTANRSLCKVPDTALLQQSLLCPINRAPITVSAVRRAAAL